MTHSPLPSESPAKVGGMPGQNNITRIAGGNPASRDAWKHIRLIHGKKAKVAPSAREDGPGGSGSPLMHMRGPRMKGPGVVG